MNSRHSRAWHCLLAAVLLVCAQDGLAGELVLKKAFIKKYKNRVTIEAEFDVDHAHKQPNAPAKDGDLHVAGRSQQVKLPMVVEIMNAGLTAQKSAVDLVHSHESNGQKVRLTGAWRLWFEHPSSGPQIQGKTVPVPENTNPDHVFEIHPITQVGGADVRGSFIPIDGYEPYDARKAFTYYEKLKVQVSSSKTGVSLKAVKARYNYAEFVMELQGKPKKVADGWMVMATVLEIDGQTIVVDQPRRMVFAEGTEPADKVKDLEEGARLHVIGIPRVNLERIAFLVSQGGHTSSNPPNLPYEMIIVGFVKEL